ncbi:flagellar assembly protein FliH [Salimicrobium flavidum]|uniref:flagellar assembly protein FliH n=1 Tax=Salimicrobium flavidum TaxID=570947 RepID=UPI000970D92D|nr:flagellar assembly protein FliH [Salimicrobium flavidum]
MSKRLIPIRPLSSKGQEYTGPEKDVLEQKKEEVQTEKLEAERYFQETKQQAEHLLQETNEQINKEKKAWEEEKKQLREQAKNEGYEEGYAQGLENGEALYASKIEQMNEVIRQADEVYNQTISDAEKDILDIAMQAGKSILGRSLEGNPEQFRFLVAEAVKEVTEQSKISIYVHQDYFEEISSYREELSKMLDGQAQIYVYVKQFEDPEQCYIESPFGRVDASIDSQLALIREAIIEMAREGG